MRSLAALSRLPIGSLKPPRLTDLLATDEGKNHAQQTESPIAEKTSSEIFGKPLVIAAPVTLKTTQRSGGRVVEGARLESV
jgi:hypothetical protein